MRFAVCSTLVFGLVGLVACENTPISSSLVNQKTVQQPSNEPSNASSDAGALPSGGGPVNDSKPDATADLAPPAVETGPSVSVAPAPDATGAADANDAAAAERPPLLSCAALAAAGNAAELKIFQWMYEVGPGGPGSYSRPYDTVTLTQDCQITYQKTILPRPMLPAQQSTTRTVTVGAADCAEARGWATNARFLEVLNTGDGCPFGMGNPDDVLDVTLTDGTEPRRKTYLCPEPTLDAVRACASALVARSFP